MTAHHSGSVPSIGSVATYGNGRFTVAVPGYSAAVPLRPGQGIFVLSSVATSWTPTGTLYTSASGIMPEPTISLSSGWNLAGAPHPMRGLEGTAIDSQLGRGPPSGCGLQEVSTYANASYATFVHGSTVPFHVPVTSGMF